MLGTVPSVSYKALHFKVQQAFDSGSVFSSHFIEENIVSVELVMTSLRSHSRCCWPGFKSECSPPRDCTVSHEATLDPQEWESTLVVKISEPITSHSVHPSRATSMTSWRCRSRHDTSGKCFSLPTRQSPNPESDPKASPATFCLCSFSVCLATCPLLPCFCRFPNWSVLFDTLGPSNMFHPDLFLLSSYPSELVYILQNLSQTASLHPSRT